MGRLVLVSVGPVQEFIAASRTSRDLAAASGLQSDAVVQIAQRLELQPGEVIYPVQLKERLEKSSAGGRETANLPNRFLCRIEQDFAPRDLERGLRRELTGFIRDKVREQWRRLDANGGDTRRDAQLEALLECHVAVVEEREGLGATWKEANRLLGARKACRDFGGYRGDHREKCTLCGQWEQMGEGDARGRTVDFWERLRQDARWRHRFGEHERLCGVCLAKRIVSLGHERVLSTEDVATGPWKREVEQTAATNDGLARARDEFLTALKNCLGEHGSRWSDCGEWLLERNLEKALVERGGGRPEHVAAVMRARVELREACKAAGVQEPLSFYYVVLHADGDRMGQVLSAAADEGEDALKGLSRKLSNFAGEARELIDARKDEGAVCIYTGGDDVLALVPLTCALEVAEELRQAYAGAGIAAGGAKSTLSVGMAAGHVRYPLQYLLEAARRTEERAKEHYGRDAFCISVVKRSGETVTAGAKWETAGGPVVGVLDLLRRHVFEAGSDRWIYRLLQERGALEGLWAQPQGAAAEVRRLIGRSEAGRDDRSTEFLVELAEMLPALFQTAKRTSEGSPDPQPDDELWPGALEDFANLCHIASFLARGGRE